MAAQLLDEGEVSSLLAFIDEFDAAPASSSSMPPSFPSSSASPDSVGSNSDPDVASGDERSSSPSPADASTGAGISGASAAPKKKKKKRSPASSSTALQRRKRAEIAALRELAAELEAQIASLNRSHEDGEARVVAGPKRKPGAGHSMWREFAMLQSRERQRSEVTNRKLKSMLFNHQQVNEALRAIVSKRSVLKGMESILEPNTRYCREVSLDCAPSVLGELERMVEQLYIGMERRTPSTLPQSVSSITDVLRTKAYGQTIQVVTTTPLSCSMEEAAQSVWRHMTFKHQFPDKTYTFYCRPDDQALEKNFVMVLRDTSSNFQVNGLQFVRKFSEADRVVIVRTDLILLPTSRLRFRDRVWTTISRVRSGFREASVVEARYQLNAETEDGLTASPDDLPYVQRYLMQRLSSNSRGHEQMLQSILLAEDTYRRAAQEVC